MDLEYRILGPLEVRRDGESLDLGGAKQRTLLATLLLRANQSVSTDQIIDELWGAKPPKGARDTVHAYARRLHRTLRGTQEHRSPQDAKLLHGDAFGYRLSVGQDQLDLHRFDSLAAQAKRALLAGDPVQARMLLHDALALWRGLPLADVASESQRTATAARLTENRLAAVEDRIEADLALQRHAELIGELDELVQTYPTRERFCEQLMLALYRSGRQVDALDTYRRTRHLLTEEYGCDPSLGLQQLEHAILTNDPVLDPRPARDAPDTPLRRVPCQLPPDINDFTGRTDVLDRLCQGFTSSTTAAPILAVAGQAGVGKSTLAVHLARQLSNTHYPDGQLYANLRGHGIDRKAPFDVLAQFLRGLGVDDAIMPSTLDEREQLFRTLLTGRRILIVLDNAPDESAVRPLLPGDPGCGAILTSRRRLGGLESARCEHLPVFREEESLHLLESIVGSERLAAENMTARTIAERCDHLPLALRIAGARLAAKPHWQPSRLAAKLETPQQRLTELAIGDVNVRSSIRLSYDALSATEKSALSAFAALPLPDIPGWVAAELLDLPQTAAEDLLERLADEQLLDVVSRDEFGQIRYRIPCLTRDFALEHGENTEPGNARVFSTYLSLATCAAQALRDRSNSGDQSGADVAHEIAEHLGANPISWFLSENHCLFSAIRHLHETLPHLCWRLAVTLFEFLRLHNQWNAVEETYRLALHAARDCGEPDGEARILHALGAVHAAQDEPGEAVEHYTAALSLRRENRDRHHETRLLLDLGHAELAQGRWDTAEHRFREVLPRMREFGDSSGESEALAGLARLHRLRGRLGEAIRHLHSSLVVDGAHYGQANRLLDLAMTVRDLSLLQPEPEAPACSAVRCFRQAARLFRRVGDKRNEMYALTGVATCRSEQGRPREAQALGEHALTVFQQIGDQGGAALAHRVVGMAHLNEGNAEAAIDALTHSLATEPLVEQFPDIATESWDQLAQLADRAPQVLLRQHGRSLHHLGVACGKLGRTADAAWYCRRSVEIAKLLGPPQWTIPPLRVLAELGTEPGGAECAGDELQRVKASIELPNRWRDAEELVGSAPRSPPEFAAVFP